MPQKGYSGVSESLLGSFRIYLRSLLTSSRAETESPEEMKAEKDEWYKEKLCICLAKGKNCIQYFAERKTLSSKLIGSSLLVGRFGNISKTSPVFWASIGMKLCAFLLLFRVAETTEAISADKVCCKKFSLQRSTKKGSSFWPMLDWYF